MVNIKPDLDITRGDTTSINFSLTDNGTPVDLTGTTVFFTAKPALTNDITDANAVIAVEITSHTNPTGGETVIELSNVDTDVAPGEYYYDIQVKRGSNIITSIRYRKLTVWADVTRRVT